MGVEWRREKTGIVTRNRRPLPSSLHLPFDRSDPHAYEGFGERRKEGSGPHRTSHPRPTIFDPSRMFDLYDPLLKPSRIL